MKTCITAKSDYLINEEIMVKFYFLKKQEMHFCLSEVAHRLMHMNKLLAGKGELLNDLLASAVFSLSIKWQIIHKTALEY